MGCRVFKWVVENWKDFCLKNNIPKGNYWILRIKVIFFNEKQLKKIPMIFYIENWLWKSNYGTFWHLPITPILKIQILFWVCCFLGKNLSNFVPPAWKIRQHVLPYCESSKDSNSSLLVKISAIYLMRNLPKIWSFRSAQTEKEIDFFAKLMTKGQ